MNTLEFREWLDNHVKLIPSVRSWLDNQREIDLLLAEWEACLRRSPLGLCKAATQAMVWGTLIKPYPEETAATVRKWASDMNSSIYENQKKNGLTVSCCALCEQSGFVQIWHPLLVRAIREGVSEFVRSSTGEQVKVFFRDGRPRLSTVSVACTCELGDRLISDRMLGSKTFRAHVRYDDREHIRKVGDWREDCTNGAVLEQQKACCLPAPDEVFHAF